MQLIDVNSTHRKYIVRISDTVNMSDFSKPFPSYIILTEFQILNARLSNHKLGFLCFVKIWNETIAQPVSSDEEIHSLYVLFSLLVIYEWRVFFFISCISIFQKIAHFCLLSVRQPSCPSYYLSTTAYMYVCPSVSCPSVCFHGCLVVCVYSESRQAIE